MMMTMKMALVLACTWLESDGGSMRYSPLGFAMHVGHRSKMRQARIKTESVSAFWDAAGPSARRRRLVSQSYDHFVAWGCALTCELRMHLAHRYLAYLALP